MYYLVACEVDRQFGSVLISPSCFPSLPTPCPRALAVGPFLARRWPLLHGPALAVVAWPGGGLLVTQPGGGCVVWQVLPFGPAVAFFITQPALALRDSCAAGVAFWSSGGLLFAQPGGGCELWHPWQWVVVQG